MDHPKRLLGGLIAAVLMLSGFIYAGIRVNEDREQRNRAVEEGQAGQIAADLKAMVLKVNQATSDERIASVAMAAVDSKIEDATVLSTRLSGKLAAMEDAQQRASPSRSRRWRNAARA